MSNLTLIVVLLVLMALGYQLGMTRSRKVATVNPDLRMHSRPHHYGMMVGLWAVLPAFFILLLWLWLSGPVIVTIAGICCRYERRRSSGSVAAYC